MSGTLRVGLTGSLPEHNSRATRTSPTSCGTPLGRNIAPGVPQVDDRTSSVPVERLIAARQLARRALRVYGCALRSD